ncbi:MAG: hypothetical protein JWN77_93 [Frankiales bacterium]|nr:hypothetical protein [Frankiales bacterium]
MRRNLDSRSDDGVILVITLAFLAFFGLVAVALLAQGGAGLRSTGAVGELGKKLYSADGAVDLGIEAVQADQTLCPDLAAGERTISPSVVVDGDANPVALTCRTLDNGSSGGWQGYGIVTTSSATDSLQTQSGADKTVTAPIFNAGGISGVKDVLVSGANYFQAGTTCTGSASASPSPPYGVLCGRPAPLLNATLPAVPPATNPAPDTLTRPGCTIFSPGVYTSPPVLGDNNYFKSGVYYFNDVGTWNIAKQSVVGGTSGGEASELALPCYNELAPNGSGVEFVLRGNSTMSVSNQATVELFSRRPNSADGSPGISLYVEGSRTAAALTQTNGNARFVIHGTLYSPDAEVLTNATGSVSFWVLNGIVAKKFRLQSTGDALKITTTATPSGRRVLITATATGSAGARSVMANAVVDIAGDAAHTISLVSRRTW